MCNLETEGMKYGCGHYQVTKKVRKIDCNNRYCVHSAKHPTECFNCPCEKFLGPDMKETITANTPNYCGHCQYWFKGKGSIPRR